MYRSLLNFTGFSIHTYQTQLRLFLYLSKPLKSKEDPPASPRSSFTSVHSIIFPIVAFLSNRASSKKIEYRYSSFGALPHLHSIFAHHYFGTFPYICGNIDRSLSIPQSICLDYTPADTTKMVTAATYRVSEISRFMIIIGGLCASVCMSTFYGFNILSNHIMTTYGFSSSDMTTITTTGIVVGFVTFPGGMLLDYAGPMYVCIIACVLNAIGALMYGLAFEGIISGSVVTFAVFCAIMNLGCASFDTGSLMAVLGSFPRTKGPVVAIMKTFAGLGASIFAVINNSYFSSAYSHYMYFMTAVIVACGVSASVLIRFPPYHLVDWEKRHLSETKQIRRSLTERAYLTQLPPMTRFYVGFGVIVALVVYLTTQSLCVAYGNVSNTARVVNTSMIIVIVFCFGFIAAPLPFLGGMEVAPSTEYPEIPDAEAEVDPDADEQNPVLRSTAAEAMQDENALRDLSIGNDTHTDSGLKKDPLGNEAAVPLVDDDDLLHNKNEALMIISDMDPQYQTTFWQSIRNLDLWLCMWNTFATWGCGLVIAFNSAQIYRALADDVYEAKTNTMYSAIIGVGSALGRMGMGIFEYKLGTYSSDSRPVMTMAYPVSSTCMVIGLIFLLALPVNSKAIVIGFFFDSFGNGFSWACTALTIRSIFAKDIGKHYNFMYVGAFIAVIALNRFGYGELYDREAKRQRAAGGAIYPRCAGKSCVMNTFIILICVNATAIIGSTWCHIRYRRFVLKHRAEKAAARDAHAAALCANGEPFSNDEHFDRV